MVEDQNELNRSLGRLEGKLDAVLQNQDEFKRGHDSLTERMNTVEAKLNRWGGIMATLFAIYVFLGEKIRHLLFGS